MFLKIFKYLNKFIYDNKKRDLYQVKISVQSKSGILHFSFNQQVSIEKGFYLTRRSISKAYGEHISNTIKSKRRFKDSIVGVEITCKIGTFKRKDIK